MNNTPLLIVIIGLGMAILAGCKISFTKSPNKIKKENEQKKQTENTYSDFRNMAFSVTPEHLNLKLNDSTVSVYGCIVDWCPGQNVVSIVVFLTGDVSMYLSSGQIYIGGSSHEIIKETGLNLIKEVGYNLNYTQMTNDYALPVKDNIRFYLITNKGKYFASENIENIKNKKSIWIKSFDLVNEIISDYRQISEIK